MRTNGQDLRIVFAFDQDGDKVDTVAPDAGR